MIAKYKHLLPHLVLAAAILTGLLALVPQTAHAVDVTCDNGKVISVESAATASEVCAPYTKTGSEVKAAAACKPTFFGLVPWYQYLPLTNQCDIAMFTLLPSDADPSKAGDKANPSDVPLVLLAIIDDLLRIAGLVAVGFIIYGGVQYISSQGSPDGTNKARQTILNALIGLAVSLIAVGAVSFIGNQLGSS
jgi:hypothetical protein